MRDVKYIYLLFYEILYHVNKISTSKNYFIHSRHNQLISIAINRFLFIKVLKKFKTIALYATDNY